MYTIVYEKMNPNNVITDYTYNNIKSDSIIQEIIMIINWNM